MVTTADDRVMFIFSDNLLSEKDALNEDEVIEVEELMGVLYTVPEETLLELLPSLFICRGGVGKVTSGAALKLFSSGGLCRNEKPDGCSGTSVLIC